MNMLQMLLGNFSHEPLTLRFPARPSLPQGLRGLVNNDSRRCVGCGTCAYVCTSGAVAVQEDARSYRWTYDPGACTFCGRCVDYCPVQALSQEEERPPVYTVQGELNQVVEQDYPPCPSCGVPARPVTARVLQRAFLEISPEVERWSRLCHNCRQAQARVFYDEVWRK